MRRKHVPETIDEYCTDLQNRLRGTLPEEKIAEAVAEARSHLQDSAEEIQGATCVGEKQALAQFVSTGKLARGLSRAWAAKYLRHSGTKSLQYISAGICLCVSAGMLSYLLVSSKLPPLLIKLLNFIWASSTLPVIVFCLALLACRPQTRRFTRGGLGVLGAHFLLAGWLCAYGATGIVSRPNAPIRFKDMQVMSAFLQEERVLLNHGEGFYGRYWNSAEYAAREAVIQKQKVLLYQKYTLQVQHKSEAAIAEARNAITAVELEKASHDIALNKALQNVPAELKVGSRYVVPREAGLNGDFAFRVMDLGLLKKLQEGVPPTNLMQIQVNYARLSPVEAVDSLGEALKRWRDAAGHYRNKNDSMSTYYNTQCDQAKALMESPLWWFDLRAAAWCALIVVVPIGQTILADVLGGWFGGLILREWRRRKGGNGMRLKQ